MDYHIKASSISNQDAVIHMKESHLDFGTTPDTTESLPNPAELFLGSIAPCILKNVERFSRILQFTYEKATLKVHAIRLEPSPRIDNTIDMLTIYRNAEKPNTELLKKNIEKFGTIYNTVKLTSTISGTINTIAYV